MKRRIRLDREFAAPVLQSLPPATKKRLRAALRRLQDDPTGLESNLDVRELVARQPGPQAFRLRVGDWRAAFVVKGREVFVFRIFHRRDGYGWMDHDEPRGPGP